MKDRLKFSVIVTVYNLEAYLEECLDSIISQSYENLEIICIDDGSTDNSPAILDRYENLDQRIRVIHRKNAGLVNARKQGVHEADGDYIVFVDGDDWIEPEMYETFASEIQKNQSEIVIEGVIRDNIDKKFRVYNYVPAGCYDKEDMERNIYPLMLCTGNWYQFGITQYVWNKAFERSLISSVIDSMDEKVIDGEDVALVFPMMLKARKISILTDCHYHYREIPTSMCRRKSDDYYTQVLYLKRNLEKTLLTSKYKKIMEPQLRQFLLHMLFNGMKSLFEVEAWVNVGGESFDYRGIGPEDNVILYGAGIRGQKCYKEMIQRDVCFVSAWIDRNLSGNRICSRVIESPENICDKEYDWIYVAVKDKNVADEIMEELEKIGVPNNKILWRQRIKKWDCFTVK